MITWWNTEFGEKEALDAAEVVRSGYLNEGPKTREFERVVADYLHVKHVHAVPNGTIALAASLWSLGIGAGDDVIVPDVTFIATANAVKLVGANPIVADVNLHDMNISARSIRDKMSPNVKAIIIVHINGRCCDIDEIEKIRKEFNVKIIEDTAQGLGSRNKKNLGTFFDFGTISLAPSKVISTGQGGLVVTNDDSLSNQVVRFKDHGRMARTELEHLQPGYNLKFTDVAAAIGLAQMQDLSRRLKKALDDYDFYRSQFSEIEGIKIFDFDFENGEIPLWIDFVSESRNELIKYLEGKNILPRPLWDCTHRSWVGGKDEEFPNSSKLADTAFWLPSGPSLSPQDRQIVADEVKNFFQQL